MLDVVARLLLAGVLVASTAAKLASPGSTRAALATFGIEGERARSVAWTLLIAIELGLGAGIAAGLDQAAILAAGLMAMFAATLAGAILRGRAGAPCACFGSRSTVSWRSVARSAALAAAFAALPFLPAGDLSTDEWLGLGLAVTLLACLVLAVAVLALAREVGMLRLRLGPAAALEIPDEGPELGSRSELVERFGRCRGELALAVFTSEGCRVCEGLKPAIDALRGDPAVCVDVLDEGRDAEVWGELGIPGSPYAVALGLDDGTVLAKGTFNNLAQLESVLGTAERRRAGSAAAGAVRG